MTKKQKKMLARIILSAVVLIAAVLLPLNAYLKPIPYAAAYLICGWDVLYGAVRKIWNRQWFDEEFLMALATIGAFASGEYQEGVVVMLFYQIGELFQSYAVGRSRRSIAGLMDIRPDYANIMVDGDLKQVDPDEVKIGDTIIVRAGEKVPLDGVVTEGMSTVDTSALTGESIPRDIQPGYDVISGCINLTGVLSIQVSKEFGQSTVAKILDLVENASSKKAKSENFITKFAHWYTPSVVVAAVLLAFIPPLILHQPLGEWVHRALIFLVISCPCALVISVPLSFFGGIGGASKCGILVKGSNYLEALAKTEILAMDKTGTLTQGNFEVAELHPAEGVSKEELLRVCTLAEGYSNHPISLSLKKAYGKEFDPKLVSQVEEISGHGVKAIIDGVSVAVGNRRLMESVGVQVPHVNSIGTIVYLSVGKRYSGYIVIADQLKPDAEEAMKRLKRESHIRKTVMLTGDLKPVGEAIGKQLGIDEVFTELLPVGKVEKVEALLSEKSPKGVLAFVGDGVNDAPVLTRADIGIAMGGLGSDAAIEAADIVIMDDKPSRIADAIAVSRKTLSIVYQNIVFALAVKALVLILGAFGVATMWEAVFADVGVAVIAILNAMRALNVKFLDKKMKAV